MAISKRLRYEILRRDNFTCRYCGVRAGDAELAVDHVIPEALGGSSDPMNLVAACPACNAGKASSAPDAPIVEDVAEDAVRWSRAMRAAAAIQAERVEEQDSFVRDVDDVWNTWHVGGDENARVPRPSDWEDSVRHFFSLGLERESVTRAIDTAMRKRGVDATDTWRYMCGICWNILKERQEMAASLMLDVATDDTPDVDRPVEVGAEAGTPKCSICSRGLPDWEGNVMVAATDYFAQDYVPHLWVVCKPCTLSIDADGRGQELHNLWELRWVYLTFRQVFYEATNATLDNHTRTKEWQRSAERDLLRLAQLAVVGQSVSLHEADLARMGDYLLSSFMGSDRAD